MAVERIVVEFVEVGGQRVVKQVTAIGGAAGKSATSVDYLQQLLLLLGGAAVIKKLIGVADAFTRIENRLGVVTQSMGELKAVESELFKVSERTRTSYETNAELFTRLGLSTRNLGISQKDLLTVTESLNKAIILSGASSQEAEAGLIQLSQGLAAGALRGDELRSVLEQLPFVSDVIAKQLGVSRGALRDFGAQGKITSEVIVEAFLSQRDAIEALFKETTPTVEQGFQVLRNAVVRFVGDVNTSFGVTAKLSDFLRNTLAPNIDVVAKSLGVLATALLTTLALQAIPKLTSAVVALFAAIAAHPIGALLVALTTGAAALIAFSDDIKVTSDGLTTLSDVGVAASAAISESFANMKLVLAGLFGGKSTVAKDAETTLGDILHSVASFADRFVGFFVGIGSAIGELVKSVASDIIDAANGVINFLNAIVGHVVGFAKTISETFSILFGGIEVALQNLAAAATEALSGSFDSAQALVDNASSAIASSADVAFSGFTDRLSKNIDESAHVLNNAVNPYKDAGYHLGKAFMDGFNRTNIQDAVSGILNAADVQSIKRRLDELFKAVRVPESAITPVSDALFEVLKVAGKDGAQVFIDTLTKDLSVHGAFSGLGKIDVSDVLDIQVLPSGLLDTQNAGLQETQKLLVAMGASATQAGQATYELATALASVVDLTQTPAGGGVETAAGGVDKRAQALMELNKELEQQVYLLQLTNQQREIGSDLFRIESQLEKEGVTLSEKEKAGLVVRLQALQALADQSNALDQITKSQEDYIRGLEAINFLQIKGKITMEEWTKAQRALRLQALETSTDFESGWERGLLRLEEHFNDFASAAENALVGAFDSASEALQSFITTGEFDLDRFIDSIVAQLAKLASDQLLGSLFAALGGAGAPGSGAGGIGSALAAVFGGFAAEGMPTQAGKSYVVGEKGPELFTANSPGNITPAGAAPFTPPQVNVQVVNVVDPNDVITALEDPRHDRVIVNAIRRNRRALRAEGI